MKKFLIKLYKIRMSLYGTDAGLSVAFLPFFIIAFVPLVVIFTMNKFILVSIVAAPVVFVSSMVFLFAFLDLLEPLLPFMRPEKQRYIGVDGETRK